MDESACLQCGHLRPIMVCMVAGPRGRPWRICSTCYIDGLRPMDYIEKPLEPLDSSVVAVITPPTPAPSKAKRPSRSGKKAAAK